MVLIDLFECDPQGRALDTNPAWNVAFEAAPRVGEIVQIASPAGAQAVYAVNWVMHSYNTEGPIEAGYQLKVGITQQA